MHELTHEPFAEWCADCTASRAQRLPHHRRDKSKDGVPVIQIDYLYWKVVGDDKDEENLNEVLFKSMTAVDCKSGCAMATQVVKEGNWPFIEEVLTRWVIGLGWWSPIPR